MNSTTVQSPVRQKTRKNRQDRHAGGRIFAIPIMIAIAVFVSDQPVFAQPVDESRVRFWLSQLESESLAVRNSAEQKLIASGPGLTDWLDRQESAVVLSSEAVHRLKRIRRQVFLNRIRNATRASTVVMESGLSTIDFLESVASQTGNRILLDENVRVGDNRFTSGSFWKLVEHLCLQFELAIDYQTSSVNQLKLVPDDNDRISPVPSTASGPLRLEWLKDAGTTGNQVRLRLAWEPRMRPIRIRIPMSGVAVTDDLENAWASFNNEAVLTIPSSPTRDYVVFRLPFRRVSDRTLRRLVLPVQVSVVAPDAVCHFPNIVENPESGERSTQFGTATVSLNAVQVHGQTVRVQLVTAYDPEQMAHPLQSHLDWSRYCDARLVNSQGEAMDSHETRQVLQEEFRFAIEYSFVLPANDDHNWDLRFTVPAGLVSVKENLVLEPQGQGDH